MTVNTVDVRPRIAERPVDTRPTGPATTGPARAPGRTRAVRPGQIVTAQAAVALLLAASDRGPLGIAGAALLGGALVLLAWVRLRRRWLFEWLAVGLRYLTRRHTLVPGADAAALLPRVSPTARTLPADVATEETDVIADAYGLTAVLELGDPVGLMTDTPRSLPSPASLLRAAGPDGPPTRVQLLLVHASAPGPRADSTPAASYRQLTDGRLAGYERSLCVLRVLRTEGWSDDDLRRALSSTVRRVRRRLAPIPARPLPAGSVRRVLDEAAHHGAHPAREQWRALRLGGLVQATFRLRRWPDPRSETGRRLVPRLLALPATAVTVSLSAGPRTGAGVDPVPADLTVRLAADDADHLSTAARALHRLLTTEGADAHRLDGEHLDGLIATLPLGITGRSGPQPLSPATPVRTPTLLDTLDLPIGVAGLMVGTDRHGTSLAVRLFRAEATRVALIGGVRAAQLVTLRAMALNARVVVQTARPQAWEPFARGVSAPGGTIAVVPPDRPLDGPAATPLQPLLLVLDAGPVAAAARPAPGWQADLVVRDEMSAADIDLVSHADLVILQPLRPDEAALAGSALSLGGSAEWLSRIRSDMVAVVNRRALRWALLSMTPIESQLIGPPARP